MKALALLALLSTLAPLAQAGTNCPSDMVAVAGFCMDRFEAPNELGAEPLVAQLAGDGERWCEARGKRLCSEAEWLRACEGTEKRLYPYGASYRRGVCNDSKDWRNPDWRKVGKFPAPEGRREVERLYQADRSGSHPGCVSQDGVFDLTGNAAEWVARSFPTRMQFAHVLKGCYWAGCYGGAHPNCRFVNPAHPGTFRTYEAGFRCCTTP